MTGPEAVRALGSRGIPLLGSLVLPSLTPNLLSILKPFNFLPISSESPTALPSQGRRCVRPRSQTGKLGLHGQQLVRSTARQALVSQPPAASQSLSRRVWGQEPRALAAVSWAPEGALLISPPEEEEEEKEEEAQSGSPG